MANPVSSFRADHAGADTRFVAVPSYIENIVLVANASQTMTLPAGTSRVRITASAGPVYLSIGAAAVIAVPAGSTATGVGVLALPVNMLRTEYLVEQRELAAINLISAGTPVVVIECWRGNT